MFGLGYFLCCFFGLVFPIYSSFRAIESPQTNDDTQWLVYWIVYSMLSTVESCAIAVISWIPLYYEIKFMLLLWLMVPQTSGATVLYVRFIRPLFFKHAAQVDPLFKRTNQLLNSSVAGYAAGLVDKYGPEVAEQAMKLASEQAAKLQAAAKTQAK